MNTALTPATVKALKLLGERNGRTYSTPPAFGFYAGEGRDAHTWDSLKRLQVVTTMQQRLQTARAEGADAAYLELVEFDALRAYYEYTDPFGTKTYA